MLPIILHIAVPTPLRKTFDYRLPAEISPDCVKPGIRVLIPWQRRTLVGVILTIDDQSTFALEKIRPIAAVLDEAPVLSSHLLTLATWASDYYQHPIGDVIFQMLPVLLRKEKNITTDATPSWQLSPTAPEPCFGRAKKQAELYAYLKHHPQGISQPQLTQQGFSSTVINALATKNFIEQKVMPLTQQKHFSHTEKQTGPPLHAEQRQAVDAICQAISTFKPFVLDGVTGSGKTEVYLQCIAKVLQQGLQVLVLVPEIGLTPQTLSRFLQRFDTHIVVMHSNLSDKERFLNWQAAATGQARLIIGTRSAIFSELPHLGLIIIDESHDTSFKQQDSFRYSAHDLGILRAKLLNIPIVLGSATPSLETLINVERGRYHSLRLSHRAGVAKPPTFELVDIRSQSLYAGIAPNVIDRIKQQLANGSQVLLFLNRRGFAPALMCHSCGWLAECKHCDARLTLHLFPKQLRCHHCDRTHLVITTCPKCKTPDVHPMGLGTERVEQHLAELFPEQGICRIDRDTTQKKGSLDRLLKNIHDGKHLLLLGTQMLAKGHHFPHVTLVVILNADHGFFSADFRSSERTAQLLVQVAGRAGRETQAGHVIIQTRNPAHPALQRLLQEGYHGFSQQELKERELAGLPPFCYQALLRADSKHQQAAEDFLKTVKQSITFKDLLALGPIPAPMSKRAGRYRAQLLLQASKRPVLQAQLKHLVEKIQEMKLSHGLHWSLDVDPIDTY